MMKTILLAEDSGFSIRDFKRKLEQCSFEANLIVVRDGQAVIDLLDPDSSAALDSLPDLIVLDLKMPRLEGLDVLAWIRQSDTLHDLPVIVLTTSDAFFDMDMAGALDVGEYLTKDAPAATLCAALTRNLNRSRKRLDPFHDVLREFNSHDPRFWRPMLYQLSYTPRPGVGVLHLPGEIKTNVTTEFGFHYANRLRLPHAGHFSLRHVPVRHPSVASDRPVPPGPRPRGADDAVGDRAEALLLAHPALGCGARGNCRSGMLCWWLHRAARPGPCGSGADHTDPRL